MNYKIKRLIKAIISIFVTKKMLITIIVILLSLLFTTKVHAMTFECNTGLNENSYDIPDFPSNISSDAYVITANSGKTQFFVTFINNDSYFTRNYDVTLGAYTLSYNSNDLIKKIYCVHLQDGTWKDWTETSAGPGLYSQYLLYYHADIRNPNGSIYFEKPNDTPIEPYIMNSETDLTGLLSNTITIDTGTYTMEQLGPISFYIVQGQVGSSQLGSVVYNTVLDTNSSFYNTGGTNGEYFDIPVSIFKNSLIDGYVVNYAILYTLPGNNEGSTDIVRTIYTPDLSNMTDTEQIQNTIQNNTNILNNTINNLNNSINNLNTQQQITQQKIEESTQVQQETQDFLKSDNFDNGNLNLPTSNQQDITQDGINNIFTMMYNAFTSGQAPDIVVPIPFTGKSFTIQANFLRNILNGTQFAFLSNIIELFWWYIISVFIIKDISKKMNKIKSGDIENIQNSNIKEDML